MARFIKLRKESIGISPDAIQFRGERKSDFVRLRQIQYNAQDLEEKEFKKIEELGEECRTDGTCWFNVDGLHDIEVMTKLSEHFSLDPLIISDVMNTDARPKWHEYENCIFLSTKMMTLDENNGIFTENFVLVIKGNTLITFQERVGDVFEPVRERIRKNRKRIRSSGPDYLAFALLDILIDNYIYIISRLGDAIEDLDNELINDPHKDTLHKINMYKKEINFLAKSIKPTREVIFSLVKLDSEFIRKKTNIHLKELQDNINLANDSIDSYRELLSDQLNVFHSNMSNRLNDILKVLTIFSVVFIPLSFIAGVYGTNFSYIPLAELRGGYFIMWGMFILIVAGMIIYFKRKKWF